MMKQLIKVVVAAFFGVALVATAGATQVNVAPFGTASQLSTFCCDSGIDGAASKAIDGNTDGDFYNGSVSHTETGEGLYWMVDLLTNHLVREITLWNRTDCCSDRLTNFHVSLLDATETEVFGQTFFSGGGTFPLSLDISFAPTIGRYVRVNLLSPGILQLAEVQVLAEVPEPSALALLAAAGFAGFLSRRRRFA
jgi:hypothetical protein